MFNVSCGIGTLGNQSMFKSCTRSVCFQRNLVYNYYFFVNSMRSITKASNSWIYGKKLKYCKLL